MGSFGGRLNSNLMRSAWLLGVESDTGFESQQLRCMDWTSPRQVGMFVLLLGLMVVDMKTKIKGSFSFELQALRVIKFSNSLNQ